MKTQMQAQTNDRLHSVESAGEFLGGLSPWTIRQYLTRGKLRRVKVGSRTFCYESDLRQLIRVESQGEAAERNIAVGQRSSITYRTTGRVR